MKIIKPAFAGTLESSDLQVRISPNPDGDIHIYLDSTVQKQFGRAIEKLIQEVLRSMGVSSAILEVEDKGALDCVIKARVQAAVMRAAENNQIQWSKLS
ncbi:citrate lyase acyl carrier protein [Vibrio sp. V27_P1S3P104]|nr:MULTISPECIES: citrate lyase acyl carrier protein [unclassified Vibrio]NAW70771.1 citrate lyase acyl carrier protein [Vibrio sp. V28_P6S34P95]NAX06058.1 citrate lyase acyl carrier protein [Vibrio sp. V30_P3S12P165]NAX38347.1 citrate lyase acyl carrier protein [Vibrio sp. V27_P1S3P104]NAX40591.1 citrate lyase acyl carrier protein [Vibrio sp. V26_P1S5P106]